jgi:hypothetical protein
MANRNRVIYQSEGLFVSENASSHLAADVEQLGRVQSANYSFTINRQDVNQYGDLARIDSLVLDPPTVSLDFSYYLTDGFNERALGFYVANTGSGQGVQREVYSSGVGTGNFASGHLTANSGVNMYIVTSPDGEDLNKAGDGEAIDGSDTVIGIGNCYISDYSLDLSVGSLPTVNVTMEGANMRSVSNGSSIGSPAIDQEAGTALGGTIALPNPTQDGGITGEAEGAPLTALRPGDVTVNLAAVNADSMAVIDGNNGAHIQSVSLSMPLSRSPIQRLGSKFPFARSVDFPVDVSMSVSAIMNDTRAANLVSILDAGVDTISFAVADPNDSTNTAIRGDLKGVKLDSESFSSSVGSNKTVDLTFSTQVGGPNDTDNGFFMSGIGFNHVFI